MLAIVAVALTVVSLGAATPAVIAAGASIGAAGLSTYMAYEEYKDYTSQHAIAEAGLAEDPSTIWLVLAIVGAGVEMAATVKAVRALSPAAKALNARGDVAEFTNAVQALRKANEIDARIAQAASKAAEARKGFTEATGELTRAMSGKMYSFPGPLTDPDVYRALVKMALAKLKEGFHSAQVFVEEVKQARLAANLGKMTPEELTKAKEAWAEALTLEKTAVEDAAKVGTYNTKIKWGIAEVEARPFGPGYWGTRTPQGNARVNAYELKLNPNNESFFLPHPDGGFVQFENIAGTVLQDGKLIASPRSMYHVADMPPFAKAKVLEEANRQVAAAQKAGMSVEWLVSEQRAITQLDKLFKDQGLPIVVRFLAE